MWPSSISILYVCLGRWPCISNASMCCRRLRRAWITANPPHTHTSTSHPFFKKKTTAGTTSGSSTRTSSARSCRCGCVDVLLHPPVYKERRLGTWTPFFNAVLINPTQKPPTNHHQTTPHTSQHRSCWRRPASPTPRKSCTRSRRRPQTT